MADKVERQLPRTNNAANTIAARQNGWGHWWDWCEKNGRCPFPCDPADVVEFINHMGQTKKPSTVAGYVSAISVVHKERKLEDKSPLLNIEVRRAKASVYKKGAPMRQAKGMTGAIRDAMIASCTGDDLESVRDRALISISYDTLARLGELANLEVAGVERAPGHIGGTGHLERTKTDGEISVGRYAYLSVVSLDYYDAWLIKANITAGPVFRSTHNTRLGKVALSARSIARALKKRAATAGLPEDVVKGISGHSGRVGAAQDMAAQREHSETIMLAGGWRSVDSVRRYTEKMAALVNGAARMALTQGRAGLNNLPKIKIEALDKMDLLLQSQIIAALATMARVDCFENPQ